MAYPKQGQVYTVREIQQLELKDNAFLRVPTPASMGGNLAPMQGDGMTEEVLSVIGELKFSYLMTTEEWIPLFNYAGTQEELDAAMDIELSLMPYFGLGAWVTAKGHYVEQDYKWDGDNLTTSYSEPEPAPQYLIDARDKIAAGQ